MGYWLCNSNFLVVVSVPDESALQSLGYDAVRKGLAMTVVREPDLNNEVTAIALGPGLIAQKLCAQFPLALKERVMT